MNDDPWVEPVVDAYAFEREEARFAAQVAEPGSCADGRHCYLPDRQRGVTCRSCGDYISPEEL